MIRIYKYPLEVTDDQTKTLQGKPLSVINQNGYMCLYALHDENVKPKKCSIHISGTGHPIDESIVNNYTFLGTVTFYGDNLVFHVFYKEQD